jgi:thiol-disulfide isomerase/thioredoxin
MLSSRSQWVRFSAALGTLVVLLALGCPNAPRDRLQGAREGSTGGASRLHAVLVNGGGRPPINYYSHLDHLRRLVEVLEATGVEPARIAIFSGDGADPSSDLATREGELPEDFWLLPRGVGMRLRPPIEYVDSKVEGFVLREATRDALRAWFEAEGARLARGDTLLLYVTDHGEKNKADLRNNSITLWGEKLSVSDLRSMLALLDPGVRVVMLMSQCYSGAFANAAFPDDGDPLPRGNVCGYFSVPADRKAHGCYPEISGKEATGHSHRVFEALAEFPRLPDAQRKVLVSDGTPDVPNATSSLVLARLLEDAAERGGHETSGLVELFLEEAFREPLAWEREIRLLDGVGQAFGIASPRSLEQLDAQVSGLTELRKRLATYADRWARALEDLRRANLAAFQTASPKWKERLDPRALAALAAAEKQQELAELLPALREFTNDDDERAARLGDLLWKSEQATAARYRADVRLAGVLRMRTVLMDLAGRHYLNRYAPPEEREALARLDACEDLALVGPEAASPAARPEPFPTLSQERQQLEAITPSWLGLRYRPPRAAERRQHDLPAGATVASEVFPDSPASAAGLQVADVILGPPGEPFRETHGLREWVMRSEVGRPHELRILRNGEERGITIALARYPLQLPSLPGPLEVGSLAPPIELEYLPEVAPPEPSQSRLLFFWASWCGHCKKALPEVLAFGKDRSLPVIGITDELPEEIEDFFEKHPSWELPIVATDPRRAQFQRYGVSGTPTFVLLDAEGIVRHYQTGYNAKDGLRIEGWQWGGQ